MKNKMKKKISVRKDNDRYDARDIETLRKELKEAEETEERRKKLIEAEHLRIEKLSSLNMFEIQQQQQQQHIHENKDVQSSSSSEDEIVLSEFAVKTIKKIILHPFMRHAVNISFVIGLLVLYYLVLSGRCQTIEIIETPFGQCVSEYNYKVDKLCLYYDSMKGEVGYEIYDDSKLQLKQNKTMPVSSPVNPVVGR